MDEPKKKKEINSEDVEVPNLDEQMDAWCTISEQKDDTKSADDLEVDAWCENSTVEKEEKAKK